MVSKGSALPTVKPWCGRTIEERLADKTVKPEGHDACWEWAGTLAPTGYGQISAGGKCYIVHRLAWMLANRRDIPSGICVCHRCDNRKCVRPEHLFLGTYQDNTNDMLRKGRSRGGFRPGHRHVNQPRGERHGKARLTEADVRWMRGVYASGVLNGREIAQELGLSRWTVYSVLSRTNWKHVD